MNEAYSDFIKKINDLTRNKNSYYMFTDNDENLTRRASESLRNLSNGRVEGLKVGNSLTIFTATPDEFEDSLNKANVISLLSQNFDIALLIAFVRVLGFNPSQRE